MISIETEFSGAHRRQFVIGPEPFSVNGNWKHLELAAGLVLSHCPEVPIRIAVDASGSSWILIGRAYRTISNNPKPIEEISQTATDEIQSRYATWTGRWVLIGVDEIHQDASSFLATFYRYDWRDSSKWWISSSPALLNLLSLHQEDSIDSRKVEFCTGIYWYTPPRTRFEEIRRLLPSQIMNLKTGTIRARPLCCPVSENSYDEVLLMLQECFTTAVTEISEEANVLWIATSSGHDSRVLLAAAVAAGLSPKTYTQEFTEMIESDRIYSEQIATSVGFEHFWCRDAELDIDRINAVEEHTVGHAVMAIDRKFIAKGQWDFGVVGDIALRGGGFETGRCYYWEMLPWNNNEVPHEKVILKGLNEPPDSSASLGIREWKEWVDNNPEFELDWRDRICLEQCYAGWFGYVEQALDMNDVVSINPVNSTRIYSLILKIDSKYRKTTEHQKELVRRLSPRLGEFPYVQSIL